MLDEDRARVRVSLSTGELEVEGSEAFISQFRDSLDEFIRRIQDAPVPVAVAKPPTPAPGSGAQQLPPGGSSGAVTGEDFGELLHAMPPTATATDQALFAGYFAATTTADGTFSTGEVNKLLIEQGVKLSNPSQALKNSITQKKAFKVGSRFKLSTTGRQYLTTLTGRSL